MQGCVGKDAVKLTIKRQFMGVHLHDLRPKHLDHLAIGHDDALLVQSILVDLKLVNARDVRLLQAIGQRQAVILIEHVDELSRSLWVCQTWRLVGLDHADAVMLNEHG